MNHSSRQTGCGVTRRSFLLGTGTGLTTAASLNWFCQRDRPKAQHDPRVVSAFTERSLETRRPEYAVPGPFPGRVVQVHHPESVCDKNIICADTVHKMMDRGMRELTGAEHVGEAW